MIYANVYAEGHSNNSLFAAEDPIHRHNPTTTPRLLRQTFLEHGIEINTADVNKGRDIAFELYFEGQALGPKHCARYLIAMENPNINKLNASSEYYRHFDNVFAWDKRLFHLPHVIPTLIPHPLISQPFPGMSERNIFSCLINANKNFKEVLPSDLYLERIKTIRWYEKNVPNQFELYGLGWEKSPPAYTIGGRIKRSLSRIKTRILGIQAFPSFRGEVQDKSTILRNSLFSYCYENSRDLSNYITEKIFDSLVNGCIPIYWGADNVLEHIPAGCFIDRRKFINTAEVHRHLMSINHQDYALYQENISNFLRSNHAQKFSSSNYVHTITAHVCRHLEYQ